MIPHHNTFPAHFHISTYMTDLLIDLAAIQNGNKPAKPIDSTRASKLNDYRVELEKCHKRRFNTNLHKEAIELLQWLSEALTIPLYCGNFDYERASSWPQASKDLYRCTKPMILY